MARAGSVRGVRPKRGLRGNAVRIVETRVAEMLSWREGLRDAEQVTTLHNLRIAAKRVRYALEVFEVCFSVKSLLDELSGLQDELGSIHDLDVLAELLRERAARRAPGSTDTISEDAESMPGDQILGEAGRAERHTGFLLILAQTEAARAQRFEHAQARWGGNGLEDLAARIRAAVHDR